MVFATDIERNVRLHLGDGARPRLPARSVMRPRRVPPLPIRAGERVLMKLGRLDWQRSWLQPLMSTRAEVLNRRAQGPPRFLVRVDEFPYYTTFDEPGDQGVQMSRRFHSVMAEEGIPHLLSIIPQLTRQPLLPEASGGRPLGQGELDLIEEMRHSGVVFAQHGTSHRTRDVRPRHHSELCGLSPAQTDALLEQGRQLLAEVGIEPRVFVPPFNRFDARQYEVLARRFDVICGGPESVALLGFHGGPLWRGEAIYLPCYAPLYANAKTILPAVERLIDLQPGTWVPIVLHTSWELDDDFASLRQLARRISPHVAHWDELLDALDRSRTPSGAVED
jgi:hypothetical protein